MNLTKIIEKAKNSSFYLWLLNNGLSRMIPFNKPHGFKIVEIHQDAIKTMLPYKKANMNHIKGIHACALATLSEFTTGLMILYKLDVKKYRIIMKRIEMEYHFQAKLDTFASFTIDEKWVAEKIERPLQKQDAVVVDCQIDLHDAEGNHLSSGDIYWQIKPWEKVRTKMQ
jgi:acyl-coenzyme A thioesterase PaaI-like protein